MTRDEDALAIAEPPREQRSVEVPEVELREQAHAEWQLPGEEVRADGTRGRHPLVVRAGDRRSPQDSESVQGVVSAQA